MQFSGHSKRMRRQVIKSALNAYDIMREKDERGEEPLYRPKEWKKSERLQKRRDKKSRWFRGKEGKKETVIFIPATPNGDLKRRYQEVIRETGIEIAVVEVPGVSLKRKLQKSDPFKEKECTKVRSCLVCAGESGGRCRQEGVTYEIKCSECEGVYIGETSRNAFSRGLEHKRSVSKKDKNSALYMHSVEKHGGKNKFSMKVTGAYRGDALKRQITESIKIEKSRHLLNRRDEWRQVKLPRLALC